MTPKADTTKESINKLDIMTIENFCVSNYTINKVKRKLAEWEKLFTNHVSVMVLTSRIYRDLKHNNKIQPKQPD